MPSGGGYSALIMKMVRAERHVVVRGGCTLHDSDFFHYSDADVARGGAPLASSAWGMLMPSRPPAANDIGSVVRAKVYDSV